MNYLRSLVKGKEKNPLKDLQSYWATFTKGYKTMMEQESNGAANKIMHSSDVKGALKEIVQILVEEDNKHNNDMGELDCFEFFIQNRLFEYICAYTKSDKPEGFFKIGMVTIMKLIIEVKSYSFLSHCRIVPGVKQLIEMIYISLTERYVEFNKYHMIIADFMRLIMEKIQNEPYIFDLLCSNSKSRENSHGSIHYDNSESSFIPLKICLTILKQCNPIDKSGLLTKIIAIIKAMLLRNNKEILEISDILMRKLDSIFKCLPSTLLTTYGDSSSSRSAFSIFSSHPTYNSEKEIFEVKTQIEITCSKNPTYPFEQYIIAYDNYIDYMEFLDSLMFEIKNERLVDHIVNTLFNEFFLKQVQEILLDNIKYLQYRTCIQYLILMLHNMKHPKITEIMFSFLFGFSAEDKSETNQSTYNIDMTPQNVQFAKSNIEYDFENHNIDPFEFKNYKDEQENYDRFGEVDIKNGSYQKGDSGNINSNNSSNNRGPFVPLLNINESNVFREDQNRLKQNQNIIVTSSSENSDQIEGGVPVNDYADLNDEYNEKDIFGESHSRNSFDPADSEFYKLNLKLDDDSDSQSEASCKSENCERKLELLHSDDENNENDENDENEYKEEYEEDLFFSNQQNFNFVNDLPAYNPNQYFETMNKLKQDGFFDKEDIEEFEICRLKIDKHHPVTLCRRIICGIGSTVEHVSPITLKLIDLFVQKDSDLVIEGFCFKFLSEKVFRTYDFEKIKQQVIEKTPVDKIKEIITRNRFVFRDASLALYRNEAMNSINHSLNLISLVNSDSINEYQLAESKKYKQYEGKLDKSPRNIDKRNSCFDKRCTLYESDIITRSSDIYDPNNIDSDEDDIFLYESLETEDAHLTHRISVAETWINQKFDNETKNSNDDNENPLESGMLFTILFKKFSRMLMNSKVENIFLTGIFSKFASIPLSDENPATYYLHAFIFLELKNKAMGLLNTMLCISEQISLRGSFNGFDYIRCSIKEQMKFSPLDNPKPSKICNLYDDELEGLFQTNTSLVYGAIIFEEFLKEYISSFESKKYLINMMAQYEACKNEDNILDQAISSLRKPVYDEVIQ